MSESGITGRQAEKIITLLEKIEDHLEMVKGNTSLCWDVLQQIDHTVRNIELSKD